MTDLLMKCIARIRSDFPTKFGVPRQSGLVDALEARRQRQMCIRDSCGDWTAFPTSG